MKRIGCGIDFQQTKPIYQVSVVKAKSLPLYQKSNRKPPTNLTTISSSSSYSSSSFSLSHALGSSFRSRFPKVPIPKILYTAARS